MADSPLSTRVSSVIERRLDDPAFDVEGLARALGLSRSWLHRRLVEEGGSPPGTWIREARLRRAAELLARTGTRIGEVAAAVGYRDPAHFTRSFKRAFGMAPSHFRAARMPQNPATGATRQQNGKSPRPGFNRLSGDLPKLK